VFHADDGVVERFLVSVVTADGAGEGAVVEARTSASADHVLAEARAHGVFGAVAFVAADRPDAWPELTRAAREPWLRHVAWTASALEDARELASTLHEAAIPYALVKGPALGRLYGDQLRRACSDLDVLVPRDRRRDVADVLGIAGIDALLAVHDAADDGQVSCVLPRSTTLDLHWHLVNDPRLRAAVALRTDDVLERRRTVDIEGAAIDTLDPADTVLHVVSHALASGGHRLGWYADLDRALRDAGAADPGQLVERAVAARLGTGLAVMWSRAHRHLHTPFDRVAVRRMCGSTVWRGLGRLVDLAGPPEGSSSRRFRVQAYYRSTRQTFGGSMRAGASLWTEVRRA
jgi:hypothetical protein